MIYNSPLFPVEYNLEVAIGAINFRDKVIENLRQQIVALRKIAKENHSDEYIDILQYEHLK